MDEPHARDAWLCAPHAQPWCDAGAAALAVGRFGGRPGWYRGEEARGVVAFWGRFWGSFVSLAGVVGLYLAAKTEELLLAFWLVALSAMLIAIATLVAPRSFEWVKKVRDYPRLLQLTGELQENARLLAAREAAASTAARDAWSAGVAEGTAHVMGCLLAANLPEIPVLVGMQTAGERVVLLARWSSSPEIVGARFDLAVTATGSVRGVVEATAVNEDRGLVELVCVRTGSPGFWAQLAERAELDTEPPKGFELRPAAPEDRQAAAIADVPHELKETD